MVSRVLMFALLMATKAPARGWDSRTSSLASVQDAKMAPPETMPPFLERTAILLVEECRYGEGLSD